MGDRLADGDEVLFRQIHPSFIDNGQPSSQPFVPSSKDDNKLSVDRSSLTTPEASHRLFITNGYQSAAVYGITVGEFRDETIECVSDPLEAKDGKVANPAHALADYGSITKSQQKNTAKRLKQKALTRGCLHPPL